MKWFCGHSEKGRWWFRIFGYGISWKRIKQTRGYFRWNGPTKCGWIEDKNGPFIMEDGLLFSERMGINGKRIGNHFFKILKP